MKLLFIDNEGGGFAHYVEVEPNITVEKFFGQRLPGRWAGDFLIRVNRQPAAHGYVLQEGGRVTMTPAKIEGARFYAIAA